MSDLDMTAPSLTSFSMTPMVDLSSGSGPLEILAETNMDESGITSVVVYFEENISYSHSSAASIADGTWNNVTLGVLGGWEDYQVTETKGLFQTSIGDGDYNIQSVRLQDGAGNTTWYSFDDLADLGFSNMFTVSNSDLDMTAPSLTSFSMTPMVDLSSGSGPLEILAETNMDESGITSVVVYFEENISYSHSSAASIADGTWNNVTLGVLGGWEDYQVTETKGLFQTSIGDGDYNIQSVRLQDGAGNTTWYSFDNLADLGFSNMFTVSNSGEPKNNTLLNLTSTQLNESIHLDFSFENWSQSTNSFALELVYDPAKFDYENVTLVGSGSSSVSTSLNAVNNEATLIINGSFLNGADDGTVRLTFTNQLEEADIFLPTITSLSLNSADQTVSLEPLSLDAAVRNSDPSGRPVIEGTAAIGETLRVNTESITDDYGVGEFSYQWMRDGVEISRANSSTYLVSADDGDAVLSVQVSYIDQLGTLESLTSDNTSTIVSPHEYADNFTITSSFGTSVYEGTLSGAEEGGDNQISFTINQIDPQIRSVYVALQPASGQTTDFWDNFWSNKIGGEPADQFALGTFKSVNGGPVTVTYTLNADSVVEENETFVFSVYEDNMDFALGRKAIKSFEFSVLDDDATLTFTSDLYDRSGEAISGFQLSTSSGSAIENYVTSGTGSFDWSSAPGATAEFASATAYSNSSKAVTSADALDALKLSVGLPPSNGKPTADDYIAADFNRDGKVTSSDALEILKYAVGLEVERDAEWVFILKDEDLSTVGKNSVEYDTRILIEDITSDATIGLTGILIGDVNDSYSGFVV